MKFGSALGAIAVTILGIAPLTSNAAAQDTMLHGTTQPEAQGGAIPPPQPSSRSQQSLPPRLEVYRDSVPTTDVIRTSDNLPVNRSRAPQWHTINFVLLRTDAEPNGEVTSEQREEIAAAVTLTDNYFNGMSGGKIRVKLGRIIGWTALDGCADDLLQSNQFSNLTRGRNNHVAFYKNCPEDAGAAGKATMPGNRIFLNAYSNRPAWAPPQEMFRPSTLAHEFGHNLGAGHAQTESCLVLFFKMTCSATDLERRSTKEYGDKFDLMGDGPEGLGDIAGVMNPVLSAVLGVPYRAITVNLQTLKKPTTVAIQTRSAGATAVRAVKLNLGAKTLFISLAGSGGYDSYSSRGPNEAKTGRPTLLVHAKSDAGRTASFLIRLTSTSAGSGLLQGVSYPVDSNIVMTVESLDETKAVLTFQPKGGIPNQVKGNLASTANGLVATWDRLSDPAVSGYRVRLIGEGPCDPDDSHVSCFLEGSETQSLSVDVPALADKYEFPQMNPGYTYAVAVSALRGDVEVSGVVSRPVRQLAGLPQLRVAGSRQEIVVSSDVKGVEIVQSEYLIVCNNGWRTSGWTGFSNAKPPFPIRIPVPASCVPSSATLEVTGLYEDGRRFQDGGIPVKFK